MHNHAIKYIRNVQKPLSKFRMKNLRIRLTMQPFIMFQRSILTERMTGELKAERRIGAIASAQWNRIGGCFKIDKMNRKPHGPQSLRIFFYPYQWGRLLFRPQNLQQTTQIGRASCRVAMKD